MSIADRFDALLIDFYGTISAGDREAVEDACTRVVEFCALPLTPAEFAVRWGRRFFERIERSNHAAFRTLYECELASLSDTLADCGASADPRPFVAELEAYWRNPPVYADALDFLRTVDVPVVCVSNADTGPLLAAIEKHGLRFDAVVTSEMARCYKPEPLIFETALRRLETRAERAAHVGDSLHSDVAGAAGAGLATVWLRRESRIHDIGVSQADWTISTLSDFHDVVAH